MLNKKTAILVDGSSFVYRAFFSSPDIKLDNGTAIGAVRSFCSMLIRLLNDHPSDFFALVMDSGRKTFRTDLYPDYKSNRSETPEALKEQFPIIVQACESFGIPVIGKQGYEADDVIASYSYVLPENGYNVKIIGIDKDLMQLVDDNVTVFDPIKRKSFCKQDVFEKYGVYPSQMIHWQALVGDSVDNIPGVRGIGPVNAAKLLSKYETIDGIYNQIHEILPESTQKKLKDSMDIAKLSLSLVSLKKDIFFSEEELNFKINYNHTDAVAFLREFDLNFLIERINKSAFAYRLNFQ